MIGTIELEHLEIDCIVGILPFERVQEQKVFVDLAMDLDFHAAASSEDVSNTVDYTVISRQLSNLIQDRRFQLIETMAVECARLVLDHHLAVQRVSISIHKPAAVPQAKDTIVRFELRR